VFPSPIVVSACPLVAHEQTRLAMERAGAGAVVLPSLYEEQVLIWYDRDGVKLSAEERRILEIAKNLQVEPCCADADAYLAMVQRASEQMTIPVIASLNGYTASNWVDFAGELQRAGADGIELNIHHPPPMVYSNPREIEDSVVEAVAKIDAAISIPLFVKLQCEYTSISHLARRLQSGTQGLVLFGQAPSIDICLDRLSLKPSWDLTQPGSIVHALGTLLEVHSYCPAIPLAASGGIGTPIDVIRALLSGADVAMVASALYREGPDVIRTLIDGLVLYMERHRWTSLADLRDHRPLQFRSEEHREIYLRALATRFGLAHTQPGERTLHGDGWGHLQ